MGSSLRILLRVSLLLVFCQGGVVTAQENSTQPIDTILVLDASGSMWGQIDGVNKIVIAKDVVEGLVRGLPEQQRLGMVAYGHRKQGDCNDIETIADMGADRSQVIKKIRALSPKGKTPLSKSVQHAATELNYQKNAATVILVSDGLETCDMDPCALAKTLEQNGLDFTVHVVGFDVTEQERRGLACIAQETGGKFLAANNADQLTNALAEVTFAPEPTPNTPLPQQVSLRATILKGGPDIQKDLNWVVVNRDTGETVFRADDAGYIEFETIPGNYTATAVWTGWPHQNDRYKGDKTGSLDFTIVSARPAVLVVPIDLDIPITLTAENKIVEGDAVSVTWSGPDDLGTSISSNALDDDPRRHIYFAPGQRARDSYAKAASKEQIDIDSNGDGKFDQMDLATHEIGGPSHHGDYEIRYTLNKPRVILARVPLRVRAGNYSLSGPAQAAAGSTITVNVDGPIRKSDTLFIEKPDLSSAYHQGPRAKLTTPGTVEITAPSEPGDYEIRYVMANGYTTYPNTQHAVQARAAIKVLPVSASVQGPTEIIGGSVINVTVTPVSGDEWQDDYVSIIEPGATKYNRDSWQSLGKSTDGGKSISFQSPNKDGDYEIAYFLAPGNKIIARQAIKVIRAQASVDAPTQVKIGDAFKVKYSGPAYPGDSIIVAPADVPDLKMWGWTLRYGFAVTQKEGEGTYTSVQSTRNLKPGEYVVRYVTGHQHQTLARDTLIVTE